VLVRPEGDFYRGLAWALLFSAMLWFAVTALVEHVV
jgi:hypothetical protein